MKVTQQDVAALEGAVTLLDESEPKEKPDYDKVLDIANRLYSIRQLIDKMKKDLEPKQLDPSKVVKAGTQKKALRKKK